MEKRRNGMRGLMRFYKYSAREEEEEEEGVRYKVK